MISVVWRYLSEDGGVREQAAVMITHWDDEVPWVGEEVGRFRIWKGRGVVALLDEPVLLELLFVKTGIFDRCVG